MTARANSVGSKPLSLGMRSKTTMASRTKTANRAAKPIFRRAGTFTIQNLLYHSSECQGRRTSVRDESRSNGGTYSGIHTGLHPLPVRHSARRDSYNGRSKRLQRGRPPAQPKGSHASAHIRL